MMDDVTTAAPSGLYNTLQNDKWSDLLFWHTFW